MSEAYQEYLEYIIRLTKKNNVSPEEDREIVAYAVNPQNQTPDEVVDYICKALENMVR